MQITAMTFPRHPQGFTLPEPSTIKHPDPKAAVLATSPIAVGNGGRSGRLNCSRCPKAATARKMFAVVTDGNGAEIVCKRCKNRMTYTSHGGDA